LIGFFPKKKGLDAWIAKSYSLSELQASTCWSRRRNKRCSSVSVAGYVYLNCTISLVPLRPIHQEQQHLPHPIKIGYRCPSCLAPTSSLFSCVVTGNGRINTVVSLKL
jgi:hypothetical protein